MPTEMHKFVARLIWQSYSTLDIVTEIQQKFDVLGDEKERELFIRVGQLRALIKEARDCAPATVKKLLEDGFEFAEVKDILMRPFLLSSFELDGIISRAEAAVKAEQTT